MTGPALRVWINLPHKPACPLACPPPDLIHLHANLPPPSPITCAACPRPALPFCVQVVWGLDLALPSQCTPVVPPPELWQRYLMAYLQQSWVGARRLQCHKDRSGLHSKIQRFTQSATSKMMVIINVTFFFVSPALSLVNVLHLT